MVSLSVTTESSSKQRRNIMKKVYAVVKVEYDNIKLDAYEKLLGVYATREAALKWVSEQDDGFDYNVLEKVLHD